MEQKYLTIILALFFYSNMNAQWIDFEDQTNTRIVVSNVNDNSDLNAIDDQEKDLAVGDFDKDTFMDLVVVRKVPFSSPGGKTDLLFMNRNGVLEDETDIYAAEFLSNSTDSRDVICIDVNNDTWLDIFIISTFADQPKLFMNQGNDINGDWLGFVDESSTRFPTLTVNPIQFCAGWGGDLTGNGFADLYLANYSPSGLALDVLLVNDGTGNFTDETQTRIGDLRNSSFGTSVEFHDVDNDNDLDIVKNLGLFDVAPFNDKGPIVLFNNGSGTFTNFYVIPTSASYMVTGGDLNNNGLLDFYIVDDGADYLKSVTGFTVDQNLTVTEQALPTNRTNQFGGNVKMIDLDNDGDLDVGLSSVDTDLPPCATDQNRRFVIFENQGVFGGNLIHPYGATINNWNVSTYDHDYIDINSDGYMDIILGTCDGYQIFMQEDPTLSSETVTLDEAIKIYPNPNNGIMTIAMSPSINTNSTIEVYTVNGELLTSIKPDFQQNNSFELDLKHATRSGMYFLKFISDENTMVKKILIH